MLLMLIFFLFIFSFFFFKQKTAYEMRISDWSSDVCSSDLIDRQVDEIWDLGVRELFPYHDINSALGGTGIFNGLTLNLIGFLQTGSFWETYDCPDGGEGDSYFYDAGAVMTTALPGTGNDPDRKSTRLNSSHSCAPRMPSSA